MTDLSSFDLTNNLPLLPAGFFFCLTAKGYGFYTVEIHKRRKYRWLGTRRIVAAYFYPSVDQDPIETLEVAALTALEMWRDQMAIKAAHKTLGELL